MSEEWQLSTVDQQAEIDEPIPDPGLPPHEPRPTDVDPSATRRAERQVATLFGLSAVFTILFCVAYFAFSVGDRPSVILGFGASTVTLGICLGLALLLMIVAWVFWCRRLISARTSTRSLASRFDSGSSNRKSRGLRTSARAMATR